VINSQPGKNGSDVKATEAWDVTTGSKATVVALIDTGIEYTHPDLKDQMWVAPQSFSITLGTTTISCKAGDHGIDVLSMSCDPRETHFHGTAVGGIIAARGQPKEETGTGVTGLNWTASILPIRALDSDGVATAANTANAIRAVIEIKRALRPATESNIRIISNSWGGDGYSEAVREAIAQAESENMLFVAAAGNDGTDNDEEPFYPASYDVANVLAVTATDNLDKRPNYNYGARSVAMAAPGIGILTTATFGRYGSYSGTSFATPFVSGAAALILSRCTMNTAELKAALLKSVDVVPDLAGKVSTGGRLNLKKAVQSC
jgi:subtilisin family serine protease